MLTLRNWLNAAILFLCLILISIQVCTEMESWVQIYGDIFAENTINGVNIEQNLPADRLTDAETTIKLYIESIRKAVEKLRETISHSRVDFLYAEEFAYSETLFSYVKFAGLRRYTDLIEMDFHEYGNGESCGKGKQCLCPIHKTVTTYEDGKTAIKKIDTNSKFFTILSPPGYSVILGSSVDVQNKYCRDSSRPGQNSIFWHKNEENPTSTDIATLCPGLISDLKSFYRDGQYYTIISQYYDQNLDTHSLDTLFLRVDFRTRNLAIVQRIPSSGAWTVEFLEHKDGLTIDLIIANTLPYEYSQIFRLNPAFLQFELLQNIQTEGCKTLSSLPIDVNLAFLMIGQRNSMDIFRSSVESAYGLHQNLLFLGEIKASSTLSIGREGGMKEHLLFVATENELFIYKLLENKIWSLSSSGILQGIQNLVSYNFGNKYHLFVASSSNTTILSLVVQGNDILF